jgi:hypothetical protein
MHCVLLFATCRDAANLKLASKKLYCTVARASSFWAPMVEARMQESPHLSRLWPRLRTVSAAEEGAEECERCGGAAVSWVSAAVVGCTPPTRLHGRLLKSLIPAPPCHRIDWLQVWCCLERATQGPWSMDVTQLSRRAAPNGVLLIFELLLQHFPPSADAAAAAPPAGGAPSGGGVPAAALPPGRSAAAPVVVQQHAWKDNVSDLSFLLDGRRVEVVVDTSGRCARANCAPVRKSGATRSALGMRGAAAGAGPASPLHALPLACAQCRRRCSGDTQALPDLDPNLYPPPLPGPCTPAA